MSILRPWFQPQISFFIIKLKLIVIQSIINNLKSSIWHDKSYNDVYVYNEIDVWYTDMVRWYNKAIRELFSCENVSNMIVGQLGVIISRLTMISFINFTHLVSLLLYGSLFALTAVVL